jgi:uncharacterized protein (DUF305 family)
LKKKGKEFNYYLLKNYMENKNNVMWVGIGGIMLGLIIGAVCFGSFGIWSNKTMMNSRLGNNNMHMMDNGHMMMNGAMDMESMMESMMSGLEGKTGDVFDKAFIEGMIVHHQGAVEMAQMVLVNSKRPELIKLANDIISAQTQEIGMMQEWQKMWFK